MADVTLEKGISEEELIASDAWVEVISPGNDSSEMMEKFRIISRTAPLFPGLTLSTSDLFKLRK